MIEKKDETLIGEVDFTIEITAQEQDNGFQQKVFKVDVGKLADKGYTHCNWDQ